MMDMLEMVTADLKAVTATTGRRGLDRQGSDVDTDANAATSDGYADSYSDNVRVTHTDSVASADDRHSPTHRFLAQLDVLTRLEKSTYV